MSAENSPLPCTAMPATSVDRKSADPMGNDSGFGVTALTGIGEGTDGDSRSEEISHAEPELAQGSHISEEMQRVLRGEDPDFQAPQLVTGRASRSRAHLPAMSPKTNTTVKKNMKKGTPTLSHPPIPPSNP